MPRYSYFEGQLVCPNCKIYITDLLWFQWGFSRGYGVDYEQIYQLNTKINWHVCKDGSVPAWAYFYISESPIVAANLGDPKFKDLIVLDNTQNWLHDKVCDHCQNIIGGGVIKILDNTIVEARLYKQGEFSREVDIYIIEADGSLKPMPEWNDYPMQTIEDC